MIEGGGGKTIYDISEAAIIYNSFLPIRFKTLKKHEWTPNYEVTIAGTTQNQTVEMLIDSGADEVLDIIIGREVIFDAFDVEFKQADEMIVFKKRETV